MRYSSTLVLSTLAVGQAAAANVRHASFHARRSAERNEKRTEGEAVAWGNVAYDLSKVDWSKVNWSSVFNSEKAAPTPTPEPSPAPVNKVEVKTSQAPAPTSAPVVKPSSTEAEKPKETKSESSNPIGDIVNDIMNGVDEFCEKIGISKAGVNSKTPNGGLWLGSSDWDATFTNGGSEDIKVFCWEAKGFSGMSLNVNQPAISVNLAPGASQTVSFAPGVPASCAPADDNTQLALFGGIMNTWWEATFGENGAFDVSRNVWMKGTHVSSKGSKCTSDMETCVFKCKGGMDSCEKGTDYDLFGCGAGSGGGGGYDSVMAGTGGGCAMGGSEEHVNVTFS